MVTEKDVIEHLNRVARDDSSLNPNTRRYVQKLRELEQLQSIQQQELDSLRQNVKNAKEGLQRTRGAISVILEMAAEEEGLFKPSQAEKSPEQSE